MKSVLSRLLMLILIGSLFAVPALATGALDTADVAEVKLQSFYDGLAADGILPGGEALDALGSKQTFEGTITAYYTLADYMTASTMTDDELSFTYQLFIAQADIPDNQHADDLFARYIRACTSQAISMDDAVALVGWLREYSARTSLYGMAASRDINGFTVTLSTSLSDSEESISLVQYSDMR